MGAGTTRRVLCGQAQPDPDQLNKLEPDRSPEPRAGSDCNR